MNNLYHIFAKAILFGLVVLLAVTYASCGQAKSNTQSTSNQIDQLVSLYAEYGEFNGAILVVEDGEAIYQKGHGFANMEWEIPNQIDTKFRIGSITKQFTAMLIVQLVEENKLDLHTPISAYLPEYPEENGKKITIHHLLTHSSGIPNSYESTKKEAVRPDSYRPATLVEEFSALPLEFEPGEKFSYSNAGYVLLGYLVEQITGKSYEQALKDMIFAPLSMENTGFDKHRPILANRASGYFKNWGEYYNANYIDMSTPSAAGSIYSTVEDLYRWDQALYSEQLVSQEYLDLIFAQHIPDPDYGGQYGYGWSIKGKPLGNSAELIQTVGHDGVIDGFCAIYTRIPSSKISIILLSNIRRAPLNAMTKGIMGILYDKPYDFPKKSLAYSLLDVIDEGGIDGGTQFFEANKGNEAFYLREDEINIVSYKLLQSDRAQEAADVLKLGIEVFPEAFNLYDSYGEVLRNLGKDEEAIENYKKSVELNPSNENGIRMLIELGVDTANLKN